MQETIYCDNCDNEALYYYTTEKGGRFHLCQTCKDAFELGQVNAEVDLLRIDAVLTDELFSESVSESEGTDDA